MISFLFSVFLPGIYVAICTFHQEIIPETMIFGIGGHPGIKIDVTKEHFFELEQEEKYETENQNEHR